MSDPSDARAWIERAEEDYALARSALRRKEPLTYGACFHAQQCAEKHLKATLVAKDVAFASVHDLILLSDQCERAGAPVAIDARQLNLLSDCAVRVRYPGEGPTLEEAHEAVEIAKAVRRLARRWLEIR